MPNKGRNKRLLGYIIFVALFVVAMLYFLQEKFIFLPTKLERDYTYEFTQPFEELFLTTADGAELNGIHFTLDNPKGIIVYYHGNAGDLARWGEIGSYFLQFGYEVLIMDYRTYGKSTGTLSEEALLQDAVLFYEKAKATFSEEEIIIYGRSLGTSMASYVAAHNSPSKLILETPFYSLEDLVGERFPYIPLKSLLRYKFRTNDFLSDVSCPVTIVHGTEDSIVPYESGEKLFKTLPGKQGTLITVPGGEHNDLINFREYREAIQTLLL